MTHEATDGSRRLAAIMFTDMVGYSAFVQRDEARALRSLREHQSVVRPLLLSHNGKEIKTIGDAFLVEFGSALDAVRCAMAIQSAFHERNSALPVAEHIRLRIGIHVGDVVHRDADVLGDGVNIASRIEPCAPPEGICISEDVARQIRSTLDVPVHPMPRRELKNIDLPVSLYSVALPWVTPPPAQSRMLSMTSRPVQLVVSVAATATLGFLLVWAWPYFGQTSADAPRTRIAVLPFENLSSDASEGYFAEGMTEELISTLSGISGMEVIARTSSGQYQQASLDLGLVSKTLNAGTILLGSVRRAPAGVRIAVRLLDASDGKVLWTESYDRTVKDVLSVQNDIAVRVAGALKVQLLDAEQADLRRQGTNDAEAWRLFLLGRFHLNKRTEDDIEKALGAFNQAITIDPGFAATHAGRAECYTLFAGAGYGRIPRDKAQTEAIASVQRALEIDPRLADAYAVRGYISYRLLWHWAEADSFFRRAIELKPSFARAHEWYALYLSLYGRTKEGIAEMERALSLDPGSPSVKTGLGRLFLFDKQNDRSIQHLKRVAAEHPTYAEAQFALGLSYAYGRQYQESIPILERAAGLSGRRPVILADLGMVYALAGRHTDARKILASLDSLDSVTHVPAWYQGMIYLSLGELDKGFARLEQSVRDRDGLMVYMGAEPSFVEFRKHPRFKAILRSIGLPQ